MLTDELIDSIRLLLGASVETIPDAMIQDPLIGGAVEQQVRSLVGDPAYEDWPPDEQTRMQQAVAYLVAARLLGTGAMRSANATQSERFSDQYQVQRNAAMFDLTSWQADLKQQADDVLAPLLKRKSGVMFTLAPGRRGA
mgnify:CR=1 FL=1